MKGQVRPASVTSCIKGLCLYRNRDPSNNSSHLSSSILRVWISFINTLLGIDEAGSSSISSSTTFCRFEGFFGSPLESRSRSGLVVGRFTAAQVRLLFRLTDCCLLYISLPELVITFENSAWLPSSICCFLFGHDCLMINPVKARRLRSACKIHVWRQAMKAGAESTCSKWWKAVVWRYQRCTFGFLCSSGELLLGSYTCLDTPGRFTRSRTHGFEMLNKSVTKYISSTSSAQ